MLKLRKNSFLSLGILCITIIESLGTICYHKEKWYFIINSLKCFEELILENKIPRSGAFRFDFHIFSFLYYCIDKTF